MGGNFKNRLCEITRIPHSSKMEFLSIAARKLFPLMAYDEWRTEIRKPNREKT